MSNDTGEQSGDAKPSHRKELVDLAVKFLNNPRVAGSPLETKQAFLKKKGLTDDELSEAIQQAQRQAPLQPQGLTSAPLPPPPPPPPPRARSWQEYAIIVTVAGGLGYALVRLIKKYVLPWLLGNNEQREQLEAIRASIQELQNSIVTAVSELREATRPMHDLLTEQKQQLQALTGQVANLQRTNTAPNEQLLRDIQGEVGTLKGLLLSRHQFPTFSGDGGIPTWQRASKAPLTLEQVGGAGPPTSRPTDDLEGLDSRAPELKPT
ncbi:hypothetical protein EMCRGX_G016129 [Ephydatia muelleri]|eukprot:Em0008g1071a